mgnify:CR=1 FL=1
MYFGATYTIALIVALLTTYIQIMLIYKIIISFVLVAVFVAMLFLGESPTINPKSIRDKLAWVVEGTNETSEKN